MPTPICRLSLLALVLGLAVAALPAQPLELPQVSPKCVVTQTIGTTTVTLTYCRPGVKGREIWGGLVPWDAMWRTGANAATTIAVSDAVKIGGQELAAGTYSLFTIPGKEEWSVVLNKNLDLWGTMGHKPEEDVLKLKAKPAFGEHVEWMDFTFTDLTESSATLVLQWEKLRLPIPLAVDTKAKVMTQARKTLARYWVEPYRAALFSLEHDGDMPEALKWIDMSVTIQETFQNLALKARILAKLERREDAVATMTKALQAGAAMPQKPYNYSQMEDLLKQWQAK